MGEAEMGEADMGEVDMGEAKGVKSAVEKQTTKSVVDKPTTKRVTSVVDGLAKRGERTAVGCIRLCNAACVQHASTITVHHSTKTYTPTSWV
jgi:hypothetical protein